MADPSWNDSVTFLSSLTKIPAALATGRLLAQAQERWGERVIPRTSMHDLLFTLPGHEYPFAEVLRVVWVNGAYSLDAVFRGRCRRGGDCRGGRSSERSGRPPRAACRRCMTADRYSPTGARSGNLVGFASASTRLFAAAIRVLDRRLGAGYFTDCGTLVLWTSRAQSSSWRHTNRCQATPISWGT
jgi:hypothetical protein